MSRKDKYYVEDLKNAVISGCVEDVRKHMEENPYSTTYLQMILNAAVDFEQMDVLKCIVETSKKRTIFNYVLASGYWHRNLEIVKYAIENGASPYDKDSILLGYRFRSKDEKSIEIIKYLIFEKKLDAEFVLNHKETSAILKESVLIWKEQIEMHDKLNKTLSIKKEINQKKKI